MILHYSLDDVCVRAAETPGLGATKTTWVTSMAPVLLLRQTGPTGWPNTSTLSFDKAS